MKAGSADVHNQYARKMRQKHQHDQARVNAIEDKIEAARRRKEEKLKKNAAKSRKVGVGHNEYSQVSGRTRPNSDIAPKARRKKKKQVYNEDIDVGSEYSKLGKSENKASHRRKKGYISQDTSLVTAEEEQAPRQVKNYTSRDQIDISAKMARFQTDSAARAPEFQMPPDEPAYTYPTDIENPASTEADQLDLFMNQFDDHLPPSLSDITASLGMPLHDYQPPMSSMSQMSAMSQMPQQLPQDRYYG